MKYKVSWFLVLVYAVTVGYEIVLNTVIPFDKRSTAGAITQIPEALIPVIGSFIGLSVAKSWGGMKSRLGKAVTFYTLGVLAWGLGEVGWLIYIYVLGRTEVPYPSPADFIFMMAQLLWFAGSIAMAKVIGAQYGFKHKLGWLKLVTSCIFSATISYVLLVLVARKGVLPSGEFTLRTFFDFYYPIATALSLTFVFVLYVLSRRFLGGLYKTALRVLFAGFIFQFFGDFLYTLTTTSETYYNGHWADVFFTTSMLILTIGLLLLDTKRLTSSNKTVESQE